MATNTTTTAPAAAGRPAARRRHPFACLLRTELRLFARSLPNVLWSALLPVVAVIVLGIVPGTRHPSKHFDGQSALEVYLPILMVYVFVMASVNLLPAVLSGYRQKGVLRRLSTTPVPPWRLLAAQGVIFSGVGIVVDAVILAIGTGCGARAPHQFAGFVLSLLLIAAATLGIGLLVTAVAPTERVANGLGMLLFFPMMFFAGLWVPRSTMNRPLRTISDWSPLGAGVRAVSATVDGHWPSAAPLLVLVGYAAICSLAAARLFRWE